MKYQFILTAIIIQLVMRLAKSITFDALTQSKWDTAMNEIAADSGRTTWTSLKIDAYDGGVHDVADYSKIVIIKDCVALTKLDIEIGRQPYQQDDFDIVMESIVPLVNLTDLRIFFYYSSKTKLDNVTKLKPILDQLPNLTRLYLHFGYNQITDFCSNIGGIKAMHKLKKELVMAFYYNRETNVDCYEGMFDGMVDLEIFNLNLQQNLITTMAPFTNAFQYNTKLKNINLNLYHNDIKTFTLQESFINQTVLTHLYLYLGPSKSQGFANYQNYTIYNSNLSYYRIFMKEGNYEESSSQDMFANMPNLQTLDFLYRDNGYKYSELKYVVDAVAKAPKFKNLQMSFQYVTSDEFNYDDWSTLLDNVRDKIEYIYIYDDACYCNIGNWTSFTNVIRDTPKLRKIYLREYHYRNVKVPAKIEHPTLTEFTMVYYTVYDAYKYLAQFNDFFSGMPMLKYPYIEFSRSKLNDTSMQDFHNVYKSLAGRILDTQLYINLNRNSITNLNFLNNPYDKIYPKGYFYLNLQYNQIQNFNGFQQQLESMMHPDWHKLFIYAEYNQLNDVTGLASSFQNFKMTYQIFEFEYNQIPDYSQFLGITEGQQDSIYYFRIYLHNNLWTNQTVLNDVLLPITYPRKAYAEYYSFSYIDIEYSTVYTRSGCRGSGRYPAISEKGVCWSTYSQAMFYYETTEIIDEVEKQKKNCGNCHTDRCHSCYDNGSGTITSCFMCRYSVPSRILSNDCKCPIGYYEGTNWTCPQCMRVCHSCENGTQCTQCVSSTPSRIPITCLCPVKFYDNLSDNDCKDCISGCDICNNGSTCQTCTTQYYLNSSNKCIICPQKYAKCTNPTTGQQCKGTNRTTNLPDCECQAGYVDIDGTNIQDCVQCTSPCKECINSKTKCIACIDGYYLNGNACIKCPNKYAKCSNPTTGLECQGSNRSSTLPSCPCNTKYYDDLSNANCPICENNCLTCNTATYCNTCHPGYYLDNNTCPQCPMKYETCSDVAIGTQCRGANRTTNLPDCECQVGYVDVDGTNIQDCVQCTSPCKECINSKTKCIACIDGYYLNGNACIKCPNKYAKCSNPTTGLECQGSNRSSTLPSCPCNTKYYDDLSNANCPICENNCLTCNTATYCNTCHPGYYLDNNTCPQCPMKYETCSDVDVGTKCRGANRTTNLPDCECQAGYVDIDGTNIQDCIQCTSPCKECINSKTKCIACIDGYYLNGNACIKCPNKYAKCSNPTTGLECQGSNRSSTLPSCPCNTKYYDDLSNANCPICENNCLTCNTATYCNTCHPGYYLDNNTCPQCPMKYETCSNVDVGTKCRGANRTTNLPDCECQAGYVDVDGTNIQDCVQCTSPCKECINSKTKCIACIDGYYLNGNACIKCPNKYAKCSNPTTGLECQGSNRSSTLPSCPCNTKYYDDLSNANCPICENNCLTCNTATYCNTCHPGYYLDNNTCPQCPMKYETCSNVDVGTKCRGANRTTNLPDCECQAGYVDVDGTNIQDCVQCTSPCKECINSKTKCIACIDGYYLNGNACIKCPNKYAKCSNPTTGLECQGSNRSSTLPSCPCNTKYYDDLSNANCPICENNCLTCNTATYCNTCHPGYYLDNNTCPQCPMKYETCSDVAIGTQCRGANRTTNLPDCECQAGYVDVDGTNIQDCVQCTSPCKECINSKTKCIACIDGYYLNGNACIKCPNKYAKCSNPTTGLQCQGSNRSYLTPDCLCEDTFYDNGTDANCVKCTYPCLNCDSNTNCLTCTSTLHRNQNTECSCHQGYYDNSSTKSCEDCLYKCDLCTTSFDQCDTCSDNTNRDLSKNCQCVDTYFDIIDQELCEKCIHPCQTCTDFVTCKTCLFSSDVNRNDQNGGCLCKKGYYDGFDSNDSNIRICLKCSPKCSACSDYDTCTECDDTSLTNRSLDLSKNCACKNQFYEDSDENLICKACVYPCNHCISDSICIVGQCATIQNRDMTSNKCGCASHYYDDGSDCKICSRQCAECEGDSNNCIGGQCSSDTREDYPNCTCKQGLKETGEIACGICSHKCLECLGSGEQGMCTICIQGLGRLPLVNQDSCGCKEGFYDIGNSDCEKCYPTCKSCSDGQSCDSCNGNIDGQKPQFNVKKLCKPFMTIQESSQASFSVVDPVNNILVDLSCDIKCQSCESTKDNCLACVVGINRNQQAPQCNCIQGYHDRNGSLLDCVEKCDSRCLSCSDYLTCNTCNSEEKWEMDHSQKMCVCMQGYQQKVGDNYYPKCVQVQFFYYGTYVEKCPANTLPDFQNKTCVDVEYQQSSNVSFYATIIGVVVLVNVLILVIFKIIFQKLVKKTLPKIQGYQKPLPDNSSISNDMIEKKSSSQEDNDEEKNSPIKPKFDGSSVVSLDIGGSSNSGEIQGQQSVIEEQNQVIKNLKKV